MSANVLLASFIAMVLVATSYAGDTEEEISWANLPPAFRKRSLKTPGAGR